MTMQTQSDWQTSDMQPVHPDPATYARAARGGATGGAGTADLLALSFATTLAMWTVGYFCRLFGDAVHPFTLFVLLFGCLLAGGYATGRYAARGLRGGVYVGLI